MSSSSSDKYFTNTSLDDFNPSTSSVCKDGKIGIHEPEVGEIRAYIERELKTIKAAFNESLVDTSDYSVYTGTAGYAALYLLLADRMGSEYRTGYLQEALQFVEPSLGKLRGKRVTFLCGDAGPLALAAVIYSKLLCESASQNCIQRLELLHTAAVQDEVSDELLYGKAGYLYALLFVRHHLGKSAIHQTTVENTVVAIVQSGYNKSSPNSPLMYEWHGKAYVGAAHGLSGIYLMLLQSGVSLNLSEIKICINYLLGLRFRTGNFKSSLGSTTDKLVQWCHGAPGVIATLIEARDKFGDDKYTTAIMECGDAVWERGLLRKSYGLCHGTAGNAYTFLSLYRATGEAVHLHRAWQFARWCMIGDRACRTPDRPYSLFEGLAGSVYLLADMLRPKQARFPAFEF